MPWASTGWLGWPPGRPGQIARAPGIDPRSSDAIPGPVGPRFNGERAATGNGAGGDDQHVQQKLNLVLRLELTRQVPGDLDLVVLEEAAGDLFGVAGFDLRPRRSGGAKGEPAELQPGRGIAGALLDQVEREGAGFLVLVLFQDFDAIDDRAHRADQVVTDARAEQRREVERAKRHGAGGDGT